MKDNAKYVLLFLRRHHIAVKMQRGYKKMANNTNEFAALNEKRHQ